MDLSTSYLGMRLPHPLVMGASPLVDDLDMVKRIEDAGAAAIVMHSLFEEQLTLAQVALQHTVTEHEESFGEARDYFPDVVHFGLGPDEYLEQLSRIRQAVAIPVLASLNGVTPRGWLSYARLIEQAGAHGLELNVYDVATNVRQSAAEIEDKTVAIVELLRKVTQLPLAVKLSPFHTSLGYLAERLAHAGANGLVLFNRFWQPDIDIEELTLSRKLNLSDSSELLLRTHWLAILSPSVRLSLAASGGVHTTHDAIKAVMSGAHAVQMVSEILQHGPERFRQIRSELSEWLERHEYDSLEQMQGSMNLRRTPDPHGYERINYMHLLQSYRAG